MTRPARLLAVTGLLGTWAMRSGIPARTPGCEADTPAPTLLSGSPAPRNRLKLRLNIPAYRLDLLLDGKLVRRYPVAIGDTAYPTPAGNFSVTRVDWDPWWIPPASEWARNDTVTPPGPSNPMGRVRLAFHELYFIHGTPVPHSIGSPASHGCVRLSNTNAIDLAKRVLALNAPSVPRAEVDKLAAKRGKTRALPLETPVPFEVRYDLVTVENGRLTVYPDVYHRMAPESLLDSTLVTLREILGDSIAVDTSQVRRLVKQAAKKPVTVKVETIERPTARAP